MYFCFDFLLHNPQIYARLHLTLQSFQTHYKTFILGSISSVCLLFFVQVGICIFVISQDLCDLWYMYFLEFTKVPMRLGPIFFWLFYDVEIGKQK